MCVPHMRSPRNGHRCCYGKSSYVRVAVPSEASFAEVLLLAVVAAVVVAVVVAIVVLFLLLLLCCWPGRLYILHQRKVVLAKIKHESPAEGQPRHTHGH